MSRNDFRQRRSDIVQMSDPEEVKKEIRRIDITLGAVDVRDTKTIIDLAVLHSEACSRLSNLRIYGGRHA
jgi:hypothetical protein